MKIFCFDVETDGLYGEGFAAGVVALIDGIVIDRFSGIAEVEKVTDPWTLENVIPHLNSLKPFQTRREMREAFWLFWMKHKENAICLVDVGFPVESGFFKQCIQDDLENRQWSGPYPIHDVSSILLSKGIDPDISRLELSGLENLKQHHPVDDALASSICFLKAMEL